MLDGLERTLDGLSLDELRKRARAAKRINEAREREWCEESFYYFVQCAWRHIDPAPYEDNWHVEVICDELERLADGEFRDLIVNLPPRCSKTNIISVCYPAWLWLQPKPKWTPLIGPHTTFLCVSYGTTFAEVIATRRRRLIMGEWYQKHWGRSVQIREDQQSKGDFANKHGGEIIANSIEGGILGRGGLYQIIDDPHKVDEVESDTERDRVIRALREGLSSRVTDPRLSRRILTAQRLHSNDATNFALDEWPRFAADGSVSRRNLCIRMRFETNNPGANYRDPRSEEGELLWPERWTEYEVSKMERQLGPYATAGQLQQRPEPRGGGIIKREWWRLWPDDADKEGGIRYRYACRHCGNETNLEYGAGEIECGSCGGVAERIITYPDHTFRLLSVDTNYGDKEENSFSAATLWSIWHGADETPRVILTEAWRGRPILRTGSMKRGERGLVEQIYDMAIRRTVDVVLIEKKTRGVDLYNEIAALVREYPFRLEFFEPTGRGDKMARLVTTVPLFTNDLIWAPDKKWAEMVINEVSEQPRSAFSDLSDTVSMSLIWLRANGHLSMKAEAIRELRERSFFRGRSGRFDAGELYEGA